VLDSIHSLPASNYFGFKLSTSIFFSNASIYEQALGGKLAQLYSMVSNDIKKEDILTYIKSTFVAEIESVKGERHIQEALSHLLEEDENVNEFTFCEALGEVKRVQTKLNEELETSFPELFGVEKRAFNRGLKQVYLSYLDEILEDKKPDLSNLEQFLLRKVNYLNLNQGEKEPYREKYIRSVTSWYQELGIESKTKLSEMSIYEFILLSRSENQKRAKAHESTKKNTVKQ
jgi:hypothetical protein